MAAVVLFLNYSAFAQSQFAVPESPRKTINFDVGWRFFKEDKSKADGAEAPAFDDSYWAIVATPHSYNDVDSFNTIISHGGGDRGTWKGTAWYRKHFKFAPTDANKKVFIEFQGMRQAGEIFLNGKSVGLSENGVTPYGVDISDSVKFDGDNVLAVHIDNSGKYIERATGTAFQWNTNDFNPNHGGINRHVLLHITSPIHQTLPLFDGLKTSGVYVYPANISIKDRTTDVTVESQVQNSLADRATVALSVVVVDREGIESAKFDADPVDMVAGEKTIINATGSLKEAHFWSVDDPYLYSVYTIVKVDDKIVDVVKTTTGFRKTEFKGGVGTGGVFVNEKFVYLKGYAQRSSNEWAALGGGYPDWLHDLTMQMARDSHANYIRWMHITPQPADVAACDQFGIIEVAPAGDKERDVTGRQWEQRKEVMVASIIYHRNSPSILFWEAGNTVIKPEQMQEMVDIRKQWDPNGGRVIGTRGDSNAAANAANNKIAEFYGVMIGQDKGTEKLDSPSAMFRAYSAERRDRAPIIETEDFRDEAARRYWDDFSPPYFGFKPGPNDTYHWNSETFSLAAAGRYCAYWENRISNKDPARARWSGYSSIYFSDSDADGRQDSSEVARVSGKVDAMRLPKEAFFAYRVMQNEQPDIHIIGHWTYPTSTKKTIYIIANTPMVELFKNGKSLGKNSSPRGYVFEFPNVTFEPGSLKAVGYQNEKTVCEHELTTVGAARSIKLTPIISPTGFHPDGGDVALFDVEVVDANGHRCPTDDARIDFTCTGPAAWRGGYNSGKPGSINNLYLNTECGINRVAIRSTTTPGKIMITAKREGLAPGEVTVESK